MKAISIQDNRTGERFELAYDHEERNYFIDGKPASRQAPLENQEGEYVFVSPELAPGKLFHVSASDLEALRQA